MVININETIILELADRLGITAEHVTKIFVSHQQFEGVYTITSLLLFLIIGYFIYKKVRTVIDKMDRYGDKWGWSIITFVIYVVISFITLTIIGDALTNILFPEYSAVKEMLGIIMR